MTGRGWASGKLILCGEHAVVHGQPALAFAVDRGTEVEIDRVDGPTTIDAEVDDARLAEAVTQLVGPSGWSVRIRSDLPIGRGMGSSASLSVALVRAWRAAGGQGGALFDDALALERVFHRTPSGVDVAVAVHGGVLRYQRTPAPRWTALPAPTWQAVVIDSGRAGDTAALVAGVTARRPGIDPLLARIGALVDEAQAALDAPDRLGPLLDENHALLGAIGVSDPELDAIAQLARDAGARGAKLSGAGGGGVVLALVDDPAPVVDAAAARGYAAWPVRPVAAAGIPAGAPA